MNRALITVAAVALAFSGIAVRAEEHQHSAPPKNEIFEALKPLVGTWEGTAGGKKFTTRYSLTSNGTALMENLMPESVAMVDMIHPDGAGVMMTHYCAEGSQPRFRATKLEPGKVAFTFVDGTNLGEEFMSGVTLFMPDNDHLTQEWKNRSKDGKEVALKFEFTRVK